MNNQVIPCPFDLEALRQSVAARLVVPKPRASKKFPFELPEESAREGWIVSAARPVKALTRLPKLRLAPRWKLVALEFRSGENGNGAIYAVPAKDVVTLASCAIRNKEVAPGVVIEAPCPPGAATSFMDAIAAVDDSFEVYLQASVLLRELTEFGAQWHGCAWSTHTILSEDPWTGSFQPEHGKLGARTSWKLDQPPSQWRPTVTLGGAEATVEFYTYSGLGQATLYRHRDHYRSPSLTPSSEEEPIGLGPAGYNF